MKRVKDVGTLRSFSIFSFLRYFIETVSSFWRLFHFFLFLKGVIFWYELTLSSLFFFGKNLQIFFDSDCKVCFTETFMFWKMLFEDGALDGRRTEEYILRGEMSKGYGDLISWKMAIFYHFFFTMYVLQATSFLYDRNM